VEIPARGEEPTPMRTTSRIEPLTVLFCGEGYSESRKRLSELLPDVVLRTCPADAVDEAVSGVDVVVPYGARISRETIERGSFGLIQQFGVGLETVDVAAATELGVWVARVPSAGSGNAESVAEHALLLMLLLARRVHEWQGVVERGVLGEPPGIALSGKCACVVGLGGVGAALARRLQAFEMRLVGVRARPLLGPPAGVGMQVMGSERLLDALSRADFVVLCATMSEANRRLIDDAAVRAMRPGAYLINVARGGLVDTRALIEGLASGHLAGAGLDVVDGEPIDPGDPLLRYNVVLTPHIAGVTDASYAGIARVVADNLRRYACGEPPRYAVNVPVHLRSRPRPPAEGAL
jgi:phosphoglycerate dehydrogenase-like enzyme